MKTLKTRIDFFKEHPGMIIAELGVYKGEFSRELMECDPLMLYMVDIWSGSMGSGDKDGINSSWVVDMEMVYFDLLNEFDYPNSVLVRSNSINWLSLMEDNSLDCVYIDTSHTYEHTMNELTLSRDKVKSGGWIAGHDYKIQEVIMAVDNFCQIHSLEIEYLSEDGYPSYYIKNVK